MLFLLQSVLLYQRWGYLWWRRSRLGMVSLVCKRKRSLLIGHRKRGRRQKVCRTQEITWTPGPFRGLFAWLRAGTIMSVLVWAIWLSVTATGCSFTAEWEAVVKEKEAACIRDHSDNLFLLFCSAVRLVENRYISAPLSPIFPVGLQQRIALGWQKTEQFRKISDRQWLQASSAGRPLLPAERRRYIEDSHIAPGPAFRESMQPFPSWLQTGKLSDSK